MYGGITLQAPAINKLLLHKPPCIVIWVWHWSALLPVATSLMFGHEFITVPAEESRVSCSVVGRTLKGTTHERCMFIGSKVNQYWTCGARSVVECVVVRPFSAVRAQDIITQ